MLERNGWRRESLLSTVCCDGFLCGGKAGHRKRDALLRMEEKDVLRQDPWAGSDPSCLGCQRAPHRLPHTAVPTRLAVLSNQPIWLTVSGTHLYISTPDPEVLRAA